MLSSFGNGLTGSVIEFFSCESCGHIWCLEAAYQYQITDKLCWIFNNWIYVRTSAFLLADSSMSSPQELLIFIIQTNFQVGQKYLAQFVFDFKDDITAGFGKSNFIL